MKAHRSSIVSAWVWLAGIIVILLIFLNTPQDQTSGSRLSPNSNTKQRLRPQTVFSTAGLSDRPIVLDYRSNSPSGLNPARTPATVSGGRLSQRTLSNATAVSTVQRSGKPPAQDPLARVALSLVGADAEAEAIWLGAINNPELPPNERKDLIEDLNEDGFADPKNLTMDDLPLILNRIELIEAYAEESMDEINYDAFMEAYKDLVNMGYRLVGE